MIIYLVEMLDYASGKVPLVFDGWLYQLVEMIGTNLKCLKHPGKRSEKWGEGGMILNLHNNTGPSIILPNPYNWHFY